MEIGDMEIWKELRYKKGWGTEKIAVAQHLVDDINKLTAELPSKMLAVAFLSIGNEIRNKWSEEDMNDIIKVVCQILFGGDNDGKEDAY